MLSPDDIQKLCQRKYPDFLRSVVAETGFFPLEIRFGRPSTEITTLADGHIGYRIDWVEKNTRKWGRQRFPERVWFDGEADFLKAVRKQEEVRRFRENVALIRHECPELTPWLEGNVQRILDHARSWPGLLAVCRYFQQYPRPNLYAREIPLNIDTKFIERHQGVLRSLLDCVLADSCMAQCDRFEERFGLRYDEPLIRIRALDADLQARLGLICPDLSLPVGHFRGLGWSNITVIVTENKMNFLTLPGLPRCIGIWGAGNAAELLTSATWLSECQLVYWGDIDIQGFHILSRLRRAFPHVRSVMMDCATLNRFQASLGSGIEDNQALPECLSSTERQAYERVARENLRLEQERIPQTCVLQALAAFQEAGSTRSGYYLVPSQT